MADTQQQQQGQGGGSLSSTLYIDAFGYEEPARIGRILERRIGSGEQVNRVLAAYFRERAQTEQAYADSLDRVLSRFRADLDKALSVGGSQNAARSASAQALVRALGEEASEVSLVHRKFASRMGEQLEQSIANRTRKEDWMLLRGLQQNSQSALFPGAASAAGGGGGGMTSVSKSGISLPGRSKKNKNNEQQQQQQDGASSSANPISMEQWRENSPALLNQLQIVDHGRLVTLKEALTSYETLQNDLGRERMEIAERGLAIVLGWEVEQEIAEFVSAEGFRSAPSSGDRTAPQSTPSIAVVSPSTNDFNGITSPNTTNSHGRTAPPPPPSLRSNGRTPSIISSTTIDRDNERIGKDGGKTKKGGLFGALRSGKLDRRKSTSQSIPQQPPPPQQASAGRDSRDRATLASSTTTRSGEGGSFDDFGAQQDSMRRPNNTSRKSNRDSFMPSFGLKRKNTSATQQQQQQQLQATRQESFREGDEDEPNEVATTPSGAGSANPFAASMRGNRAPEMSPSSNIQQVDMFATDDQQSGRQRGNLVDGQGFAVPPSGYNRPIAERTQSANLMDMGDSDDEPEQPSAMRVNIQPVAPVVRDRESEADNEAVMLRMKNTLSAGLSPSPSSINRRGTRANRSAGRQSTISSEGSGNGFAESGGLTPASSVPAGEAVTSSQSPPMLSPEPARRERQPPPIPPHSRNQSPAVPPTAQTSAGPPIQASENQSGTPARATSPTEVLASPTVTAMRGPPVRGGSILSTSSSQQNLSLAANVGKSPFQQPDQPGFRALIQETVNVLLQGGEPVRVMVTGEIGLSLRDVQDNGVIKLHIRGHELFDRSAPNNAILAPSFGSGEYTIDASALRAAKTPLTTVFKYSLSLEGEEAKVYVPIQVVPQWKFEPTQTSFIMTYRGNPSCQFGAIEDDDGDDEGLVQAGAPGTLHDLAFSVPISTECNDLQTKPTGYWSSEKKRILWQMDELDITSTRTAKILARFQTDREGTASPVQVSWKLPGRLASRTSVSVEGLNLDEVVRRTHSGKYFAQP